MNIDKPATQLIPAVQTLNSQACNNENTFPVFFWNIPLRSLPQARCEVHNKRSINQSISNDYYSKFFRKGKEKIIPKMSFNEQWTNF